MTIESVAFIGLGAMGWHMASHLPKKFRDVRVWNRNFKKAEQHASEFSTIATLLDKAVQADIIFSCLGTSQQVEEVIALSPPKSGSIWVDCTSGDPESARKLAKQLKKINVSYLDAPVSGQTIGAKKGCLTIMVGGEYEALVKAETAILTFSKIIEYVGTSGSGFSVKAVNNILMAVNLWALAEGMCSLKAQNVNLDAALKCINASSGESGVSQKIFSQRILNQTFPVTFALDLLAKDTKIATDLAAKCHSVTPILQLTQQLIQSASQSLPSNSDFSASVKLLEQWNALTLN